MPAHEKKRGGVRPKEEWLLTQMGADVAGAG
jgi:hypothetical protein